MPKLNQKTAKAVEQAEAWEAGSGRQLLDEGRYAAQLYKVEERPGRVAPQWSWRFVNVHNEDGELQGRTNLFHSTSLSPKAYGGFKQTFNAFGYTPDSDTDEMLGEWVVLYVVQEIQEQGAKAGQRVNRVTSLSPFDPDDWDFDPESVPTYEERSRGGDTATTGGDDDDSF